MKITHMAIFAGDLEKSKEYFVKYFKADCSELNYEKDTEFKSYMLYFDGEAFLELMYRPDVPFQENLIEKIGWSHMALSVSSKEEVDELTKTILADGYQLFFGPRIIGTDYESCVSDPDGNRIEIVFCGGET